MLEKTSGTYVHNQNRGLWTEALLNASSIMENFSQKYWFGIQSFCDTEGYFPVLLERGIQIMVVNYCASSHFVAILQGVKIQIQGEKLLRLS